MNTRRTPRTPPTTAVALAARTALCPRADLAARAVGHIAVFLDVAPIEVAA